MNVFHRWKHRGKGCEPEVRRGSLAPGLWLTQSQSLNIHTTGKDWLGQWALLWQLANGPTLHWKGFSSFGSTGDGSSALQLLLGSGCAFPLEEEWDEQNGLAVAPAGWEGRSKGLKAASWESHWNRGCPDSPVESPQVPSLFLCLQCSCPALTAVWTLVEQHLFFLASHPQWLLWQHQGTVPALCSDTASPGCRFSWALLENS